MANAGVYLQIDASELADEIDRIRNVVTEKRFNQVMYSIFRRTGGHVRKILRDDLPDDYYVTAKQINSAVGNPRTESSAMGVGCTIPIQDRRGSIGGRYAASGGAHGWNSVRRKYRVTARVVKAGRTVLPPNMRSYGGQPPFRNLGSKLGNVAFTRTGRERLPIRMVSGIAIPQMPMNRSKESVQSDIVDYMKGRMEHEYQRLIAGGK